MMRDPLDEALFREYLGQRSGSDHQEALRAALERLLRALTPAALRDLLRSTGEALCIGLAVERTNPDREDDDRFNAYAELAADLERKPPVTACLLAGHLCLSPVATLERLRTLVPDDDLEGCALLAALERIDVLGEPSAVGAFDLGRKP